MLIRKGLLREDPYNYEQAFTDITLPRDETLPEFENSDEVTDRGPSDRRQRFSGVLSLGRVRACQGRNQALNVGHACVFHTVPVLRHRLLPFARILP